MPLQKAGRIAHQRIDEGHVPQQCRNVAGRGGENGFRKQQRTGGGGVLQRLVKEPAGILDAAGLEADDQAEPAALVRVGPQPGHGFERGGGGVVGDRAGAPQTRMSQERRARGGIGHQARPEGLFPAGPLDRLNRQRLALFQGLAQGGDTPAGGRNRAQARSRKPCSCPPPQNQSRIDAAEAEGVGQAPH